MKKSFILHTALSAALYMTASACQGNYSEKPQEANEFSRIISLGPAITEQIYQLDAQHKLIANTIYCERPPEAKTRIKIGSVTKIDLETVLALKPDLVIASGLSDPGQISSLRNAGVRVEVFPEPGHFGGICSDFLKIAGLTGTMIKARGIIHSAEGKVSSVKMRTENFPRKKIFIQIGARPLFTVTSSSFINDYIKLAGGINIAEAALSGNISREEVISRNPEVIIIADMGASQAEEKKKWEACRGLKASESRSIYVIDPYLICSPGPAVFADTLEMISQLIHPAGGETL